MYIFRWRKEGGGGLVHAYVWEHIFSLYYWNSWWMFMKLGRDEVLMVPHIYFCPPPFAKAGDIKTRSSVPLFVRLSVMKTLTWLISFEVLMIGHWYLAWMILVSNPFNWHHAVTLTFDILQGQSCCRAGDHDSPNLLVAFQPDPSRGGSRAGQK